ncbi:hypothetical protein QYE76_009666 [Lolium multiflorum]|uniref:Uncharacterized protein n=1 Tax=Lolium multiflorum TaxID=4521 RepID=A0AAD8TVG1_LOLMU|nr:hypothetical protein QYE76_009666 [Lolium multiflorum]
MSFSRGVTNREKVAFSRGCADRLLRCRRAPSTPRAAELLVAHVCALLPPRPLVAVASSASSVRQPPVAVPPRAALSSAAARYTPQRRALAAAAEARTPHAPPPPAAHLSPTRGRSDIPYVPTGQEEDDISSYLNLDGEDEGRRQQDDAEETSINDDLQLEVATTSGAEPSAGSSKQSSTSSKRGATKTLKQGEIYTIEVIDSATGKPLEPEKNATKFINQCGAVVRDNVSITVQEWNEPKKARLGFTRTRLRISKDNMRK